MTVHKSPFSSPSRFGRLLRRHFLWIHALTSTAIPAPPNFPGLLIRVGGDECFAFNRGDRFFGEYIENSADVNPYTACNPTGTAYGDIDGDGRLDLVRFDGIYLGHGDGLFGILSTAGCGSGRMPLSGTANSRRLRA